MEKLKILDQDKKANILAVTPLLPGHSISRDTKLGIRRSGIPLSWVSYKGQNNIPTNVTRGINEYRKKTKHTPEYVIIIDRDIIPQRNMIRDMYETLINAQDDVAYCYSSFEFKGARNAKFVGLKFDPIKLLHVNYISSNSLINYEKLLRVGGFVKDDKYKRLLDWCLWLRFLNHGYYGILCDRSYFIAISEPDSISAGTETDYREKYVRVREDFILPMTEGLIL